MLRTTPAALASLREAGRVAAAVREEGARLVVPGARVRDVCAAVEQMIEDRGAGVAFPTQSSRNAIAAHYCAGPEDPTVYAAGDLAKLDIGVHVEGWVVDTATTVDLGRGPDGQRLVEAVRAALEAAIAAATPGLEVRRLSAVIHRALSARGVRPMHNLCGHGVGHWTVHCPPPIPNEPEDLGHRLELGAVVAFEPFATFGNGLVREEGPAEVFRLLPERDGLPGSQADPELLAALRAFNGLPFARRQVKGVPRAVLEHGLGVLRAERRLVGYPPLVETTGAPVAQAEHTVYLGPDGVEVLTASR